MLTIPSTEFLFQKKLILNWKHQWVDQWADFLPLLKSCPWLYIAPPAPLLGLMALQGSPQQIISPIMTCDLLGAITGACGPQYLKKLQIPTVLLGHSEQRLYTSSAQLSQQIAFALAHGMKVLLCVGEENVENYQEELFVQIQTILARPSSQIAIAYEPKWAIGTGKACSIAHCLQALNFLKSQLPQSVHWEFYYGGSVGVGNAKEFLDRPELQGLLLGSLGLDLQKVESLLALMDFQKEAFLANREEKDVE